MSVDFTAIFRAQDKVSKELNNIGRESNALGATFKKLATVAAGVFSVAKIVDFGNQSVSAFTSFENNMNEVFTLLPDISANAMEDMTKQTKEFAKELGILPEETVPALYQALSAGVPKDNVFAFLEHANKAAIGGITSAETAVDGLTTVINSYGSDIIDVGKASDIMFTTMKLGKTNFEELSASLFNVLPTASAAGIKFEEVSAALAAMTMQGVPTSVATTQLRQAFVELTKSGTETDKIFRQIAGQGFKEFIDDGNSVQDGFQLLEKYAISTGNGINDLFGSVEAGNAALQLTGKGTEAFTNALTEMENSAGATDKAFEQMEQGFARKMRKMQAIIETVKISVGEKLVDSFLKFYDIVSPIFEKVKQKISSLEAPLKAIKDFGVSAFNNLRDAVLENIPNFEKILPVCTDIKDKLALAFDNAKPILNWIKDTGLPAIVDLLGNITSAASDFYNWGSSNFPVLKDLVIGIGVAFAGWNIIDVIGDTTQSLLNLPDSLNMVKECMKGVSTQQLKLVKAKMVDKYETLAISALYAGDFLKSIWDSVSAIGASTTAWIINKAQIGAQVVSTYALKVAQFISTGVTTGLATAQWALNAAFVASPIGWVVLGIGALIAIGVALWKNWDTVTLKAGELWDGICTAFSPIGEFFSGIWEGVKAGFKSFINFIIGGLNMMVRGINSLSVNIPDWVPLVGGKSLGFSIPEIPMLAKGSINAPNTFIAGEKGPELITGANGSRVFPSDDTSRILSALDNKNSSLRTTYQPLSNSNIDNEQLSERTFNININGQGEISAKGINKDEILDILIVYLKPILMKIIQTEIFEEGVREYDF